VSLLNYTFDGDEETGEKTSLEESAASTGARAFVQYEWITDNLSTSLIAAAA